MIAPAVLQKIRTNPYKDKEHLLPDMCLQLVGLRQYPLEESVSLDLLNRVKNIHSGTNTDNAVEVLAVSAETVAIRKENQSVLPAYKFTTHGKNGTVRVNRALLVEYFHGSLDRVQHHDVLTQDFDVRDVTCRQGFGICDLVENEWYLPYFLPQSAKVSQGLS